MPRARARRLLRDVLRPRGSAQPAAVATSTSCSWRRYPRRAPRVRPSEGFRRRRHRHRHRWPSRAVVPRRCARFFDVVVPSATALVTARSSRTSPRGQIVASGRPLAGRSRRSRSGCRRSARPSSGAGGRRADDTRADPGEHGLPVPLRLLHRRAQPLHRPARGPARGRPPLSARPLPGPHRHSTTRTSRSASTRRSTCWNAFTAADAATTDRELALDPEGGLAAPPRSRRPAALHRAGCRVLRRLRGRSRVSPRPPAARARLEAVVEQLRRSPHVPGIQANYIFGLDTDAGAEPAELLKEIMTRTPFVWSVVELPMPFGGTPLYERLLGGGRILEEMPFHFYYKPYLTSGRALRPRRVLPPPDRDLGPRRVAGAHCPPARENARLDPHSAWYAHVSRILPAAARLPGKLLRLLETDRAFRAFHDGESEVLPEYYRRTIRRELGDYVSLLTDKDLRPVRTVAPQETLAGIRR